MAGRNGNKTATIWKRQIKVYVPDEETKARWEAFALKKGKKLSALIQGVMKRAIDDDEDPEHVDGAVLLQENERLKKENADLERRVRLAEELAHRLDTELQDYRGKGFTIPDFGGWDGFTDELLEVLQTSSGLTDEEIFERLGIDPMRERDNERRRSIEAQLDALKELKVVDNKKHCWKWKMGR